MKRLAVGASIIVATALTGFIRVPQDQVDFWLLPWLLGSGVALGIGLGLVLIDLLLWLGRQRIR